MADNLVKFTAPVIIDELSYAKVGGPPDDWHKIDVFYYWEEGACVVMLDNVIECDVENGFAVYYPTDENGKTMPDPNSRGELLTRTLRGHFKIIKMNVGTLEPES